MKLSDLKPGQFISQSGKKYQYKGINKVRGVIGVTQKIVYQGDKQEDKLIYPLTDGAKTKKKKKMILIQN